MTAEEVLRRLYLMEKPILQTNDWARLRIRVADLVADICPPENPVDIIEQLRSLRLDGRVMLLPDWERWGLEEDEKDGVSVPSRRHWEPTPGTPDPPSWRRRQVFMPEELRAWYSTEPSGGDRRGCSSPIARDSVSKRRRHTWATNSSRVSVLIGRWPKCLRSSKPDSSNLSMLVQFPRASDT